MIRTGTATVPAALGEGRPAASGTGLSGSHPFGRHSWTLPRPGEQRKDACPAALAHKRVQGVTVAPIAVVRRQFPAPFPGLMDLPAVVRRPFPEPRVGQMETFSHA